MHVYVPSAPGCWAAFTSLQAHELERFGGHRAHGLVADCYMAQHPGDGSDRRDRQSVFVHLVGLCAVLERGWPNSRSLLALLTATRRQFPALTRPSDPGSICVNDLACVQDAIEYQSCAASWATEVWRSWAPAHGLIRATLDELEHAPNRPARAAAARRSGSDMAGPWAGRRCCSGTKAVADSQLGHATASACLDHQADIRIADKSVLLRWELATESRARASRDCSTEAQPRRLDDWIGWASRSSRPAFVLAPARDGDSAS